jgi:2-iminobutanoate/2-iminopropanoate deaminase
MRRTQLFLLLTAVALLFAAATWAQAPKQVIATTNAPKAIGPYSQAIVANGFVFCSGQIAIDPANNQVMQGDVKAQTEQVLKNLSAVLLEAGTSLDNAVKTTVFLKSMTDFPAMNEVYGRFFSKDPPARATVEVARLPKDVLVEIDVVAALPAVAKQAPAKKK